MTIKEAIQRIVEFSNGIKGVDLALQVMTMVNPMKFEGDEFHKELEDLIKSNKIIEFSYIIPGLEYKEKSIYFPKGTILFIPWKVKNSKGALENEAGDKEK